MFDFITSTDFRRALERDYAEMHACFGASAWKSTQVMAGSIVEALLIDYLLATPSTSVGGKDPLKLDLAEAITACRSDGLLSSRDAELSSVIRSYRNLIHPGRVLRLREEAPNEATATIALKLVDLIIAQVDRRRREAFGLTAEQLLSKVERDDDSIAILPHLLLETNAAELERFVLELVPTRYVHLKAMGHGDDDFGDWLVYERLEKAHRLAFDAAKDSVRQKAVDKFVRMIREEDGNAIRTYREAFFRASDYLLVAPQYKAMVKQHVLSTTAYEHSVQSGRQLGSFARFIEPNDVPSWLDPYIRTLIGTDESKVNERSIIRGVLVRAGSRLPAESQPVAVKHLLEWSERLKNETVATSFRNMVVELEQAQATSRP
jgi:hypothetical protein